MKLLLIVILILTINAPLLEGATTVTGTAQPGEAVTLRVIQDPTQTHTTQADERGVFRFELTAPLGTGHIVQVVSGGDVDYAIVERAASVVYLPMVMGGGQ